MYGRHWLQGGWIVSATFIFFINDGLADSTPFNWQSVAPSPIARVEGPGAAVNGKFYVFGGFINSSLDATNRVDVYDPASNTWTRLADMPIAVTHLTPAVDGSNIWFAGGFVGKNPGYATNAVWKYNLISNSWAAGPSLPANRGSGALVRHGRNLHFFGGFMPDRQSDSTNHWVLSIDGGTNWMSAAAMPEARGHMSATVLNGKIYAIGGQHGHDLSSTDVARVDIYDPATGIWTRIKDLPHPRSHCELGTFPLSGEIYLVGGRNNAAGKETLPDVTRFDPVEESWIALKPLPASLSSCAAQPVGNKIIVANGGENYSTLPVVNTRLGIFEEKWEIGAPMPFPLSEVAGGIISNKLYMVGDGSAYTAILDLARGTWTTSGVARPYAYHHHAAEVFGRKLYLFGGLNDAGFGKTQIYDTGSNTWSVGPDMPFRSAAASSTRINGEIYVSGGIVNWVYTTTEHAKFNPANNTWTMLAPMPAGRNHAGCGTDGTKYYVFGGRGGGAGLANGYNTVQIYDPASNSWKSSDDPTSGIAPLPQARGGMSKAPFYNGEFYVIGGETENGAGATTNGVYERVDIYNPVSNTWRLGTPLPTGVHGIFPLIADGRIYVGGGGTRSGYAFTDLVQIYNPATLMPLEISQFQRLSAGAGRLIFPTTTGRTYKLEQRSNFTTATWQTVTNNISGTGGNVEITVPLNANHNFFRIGLSP